MGASDRALGGRRCVPGPHALEARGLCLAPPTAASAAASRANIALHAAKGNSPGSILARANRPEECVARPLRPLGEDEWPPELTGAPPVIGPTSLGVDGETEA